MPHPGKNGKSLPSISSSYLTLCQGFASTPLRSGTISTIRRATMIFKGSWTTTYLAKIMDGRIHPKFALLSCASEIDLLLPTVLRITTHPPERSAIRSICSLDKAASHIRSRARSPLYLTTPTDGKKKERTSPTPSTNTRRSSDRPRRNCSCQRTIKTTWTYTSSSASWKSTATHS